MRRDIFEFEDEHSVGDTLEVIINEKQINITIDEPWAGDTITGFGRTATLYLPKDEAIVMAKKILTFYEKQND